MNLPSARTLDGAERISIKPKLGHVLLSCSVFGLCILSSKTPEWILHPADSFPFIPWKEIFLGSGLKQCGNRWLMDRCTLRDVGLCCWCRSLVVLIRNVDEPTIKLAGTYANIYSVSLTEDGREADPLNLFYTLVVRRLFLEQTNWGTIKMSGCSWDSCGPRVTVIRYHNYKAQSTAEPERRSSEGVSRLFNPPLKTN